jgi:putative ABC transport system substrate-binding protein
MSPVLTRRRVVLAGAAALGLPFASLAQWARRSYRIAFLTGAPRRAAQYGAFFDELRAAGLLEGKNFEAIPGGFGVKDAELAAAAATAVKSSPDAIVCAGPLATRAAQAATRSISILAASDDMVGDGLVTSMARPGGNTTGVSLLAPELDGKRQELLMEALPTARRLAALADPNVSKPMHLQDLKAAAARRGVELSVYTARRPEEIAPAMNAAKAAGAQGLNVLATPLFFFNGRSVIARALALRLPAMYQWPAMAEEGGLLGYGPRITGWYRQLAQLLVKVLQGARPGNLPIEQPTKFELVINLRTAAALGVTLPRSLIAFADKVVE